LKSILEVRKHLRSINLIFLSSLKYSNTREREKGCMDDYKSEVESIIRDEKEKKVLRVQRKKFGLKRGEVDN
jgi:hypothetical protein